MSVARRESDFDFIPGDSRDWDDFSPEEVSGVTLEEGHQAQHLLFVIGDLVKCPVEDPEEGLDTNAIVLAGELRDLRLRLGHRGRDWLRLRGHG